MNFVGKNCPVCSEKFSEKDDIVVCPKCGAPYHRECYEKTGKCIFPQLHKSGEVWHDENEDQSENISDEKNQEPSKEYIICGICGFKNPPDSLLCSRCGIQLSNENYVRIPIFPKNSDEDDNNDNNQNDGIPFGVHVFGGFDNIYGQNFFGNVKKDTDFEGVSGEELYCYIGRNVRYYLPIFNNIRLFGKSSFNFAAFFFGGLWYLYRKQYFKGIVISLITAVFTAAEVILNKLYSDALWENAKTVLTETYGKNPTYEQYSEWMLKNESMTNIFLMILPSVFSLIVLVMMIVIGFKANKGYYKKAIASVRQIKKESPSAENSKEQKIQISKKGGINLKAVYFYGIAYIVFCAAVEYLLTLF